MRSIASLASLPDLSSAPAQALRSRRMQLISAMKELMVAYDAISAELALREQGRQYAADAAADAATAIHD